MDLDCLTDPPQDGHPHTHTGIFLHGRGDTANNFLCSLMFSCTRDTHTIFASLPTFGWVFPQSEGRMPWEMAREDDDDEDRERKKMSQWFDIHNFRNFREREEEVAGVGLRESVASIMKIIDREAAKLGGRYDRIVLLGISQGAAVGMHVLLNMSAKMMAEKKQMVGKKKKFGEKAEAVEGISGEAQAKSMEGSEEDVSTSRLGALVSFSAWLPYVGKTLPEMREAMNLGMDSDDTVLKNTPILMEHCKDDWTVNFRHGVAARDTFQSFGAQVEWKEYAQGGHWFKSPEGVDDAVAFIRANVAGLPAEEDGGEVV